MKVEQFVMAYQVEQDRLRALLPEGYESLRPVLRINGEIRSHGKKEPGSNPEQQVYLELNTPVSGFGKRGWLNIASWESPTTDLLYERDGKAVTFCCPFLRITYTGVGIEGSCPAERDNDGCFFDGKNKGFRPAERINENKEFCDCEFQWDFPRGKAYGMSAGSKSQAAVYEEPEKYYEKQDLSAENAAAIPCKQILGAYTVAFER